MPVPSKKGSDEGVSAGLAKAIVEARPEAMPEDVRHEAGRALVNIVGCALGGADHPAMDVAIRALSPYAGKPDAVVLGRRERFDPLFSSFLNGISSHVHDYDDTTPSNYIHPTSPVASAMFAYASVNPVSGLDFLHAFVLGFEVVTRIGNATYPAHYRAGWHSTGSIGVFGAAAAIARLRGLDAQRMAWALGLAATQSAGLRDNFGSMAKSFHPGAAAQSGYRAALLAEAGFTTGPTPLEGPRGFAAVEAGEYDLSDLLTGFGTQFLLSTNTYKPFPCGIVIHPTIDACSQLKAEKGIDPANVKSVRLRVAPLVRDLCDQRPATGLEAKFSIYHAAAIGLVRGRGGLAEFTDEAVRDPALAAMRDKVEAVADPKVGEDAVIVEVTLQSGEVLQHELLQSLGNLARPLSDAQLEEKFRDQAKVVDAERADRLISMCWQIEELADAGEIARMSCPG
ncbi:MmgE/PrpD family protein [Jiella pacifica]|uniref:MmgE/PrpD family protein n=1 Tax=Jiella pacifica TaxID=2696469 RepID=A0A6N9SZH0_9HYPH|nr:MmgE/PrpD family protein [Jiella pacifica]NDW03166.1 MmgE/PrpD family protein [Jiella pacifica]